MLKFTPLLLLGYAITFGAGVAIAEAEISTSQPAASECGKYCENYPPGITQRMRDYQSDSIYLQHYPAEIQARLRDYQR